MQKNNSQNINPQPVNSETKLLPIQPHPHIPKLLYTKTHRPAFLQRHQSLYLIATSNLIKPPIKKPQMGPIVLVRKVPLSYQVQ